MIRLSDVSLKRSGYRRAFALGSPRCSQIYMLAAWLPTKCEARMSRVPIGRKEVLIPTGIDQNPCAQSRIPMDMIFHGWSMSLFQASQQSATMSS
jgi:hypothetical protein